MISKLEKLLGPIANKLAQQRHLQAISSGMMMSLGLIVVGSVFLIIANPPINLDLVDLNTGNIFLKFLISWKQFALANYDVLTLPYNYTMGLVGLISAFGVAYCLAESYKMKASVYEVLKASDVYVMPSVSEPFGISPLEAMQCGVPSIISKQSGCAEILDYAIKVDYWDIEALADAMYSIITYPAMHEFLKVEGKKEVDNIKWEYAGQKVRRIYDNVIGNK